MSNRDNWSFTDYIYELEYLAEIQEIPGVAKRIDLIREELKEKYQKEWEELNDV